MTLGLSPTSLIERNKQKQREWRLSHPERVKEFHTKYNAKDSVKARKLEWARNNKESINMRRRNQYKLKREELLRTPSEALKPENEKNIEQN